MPNAFATRLFSKMKTLSLEQLELSYLRTGIFNGLQELEWLALFDMNLLIVDADILRPCQQLNFLNIKNCSQIDHTRWLENITGAASLTLTYASISENNFQREINEATFRGLTQIKMLELVDDQIEFIGEKSFDCVTSTLMSLDLRMNRLKTISADLIGVLLANKQQTMNVDIFLDENPWHCDCNLEPLKHLLRENSLFCCGNIKCSTPLSLAGVPVRDAEMCARNQTDRTTVVKKCGRHSSLELSKLIPLAVKKRDKVIRFNKTVDNKFHVTLNDFPVDHVLLWYENGKPRSTPDTIKCLLNRNGDRTRNITLTENWTVNKVHTLCMKPKNSPTMTPLNCISFNTFERDQQSAEMWLPKSYQFMVISLSIVACLVCLFFGVAIVFLLGRTCPAFSNTYLLCNRNVTRVVEPNANMTRVGQHARPSQSPLPSESVQKSRSQSVVLRWHIDNYQSVTNRNNSLNEPPLPPPHPKHMKKRIQRAAVARKRTLSDDSHYESI